KQALVTTPCRLAFRANTFRARCPSPRSGASDARLGLADVALSRGNTRPSGHPCVLSMPARSQVGKELVGAGNRRDDLPGGGSARQGGHEPVEPGSVGGSAEEGGVEALDQVLLELRAAENGGGDLACRGPGPQGRGEPRQAARVGGPTEGVLVEGDQEAGVG